MLHAVNTLGLKCISCIARASCFLFVSLHALLSCQVWLHRALCSRAVTALQLLQSRAATAMKLALVHVRVNPHNPMPHLPPSSAAALPLQLQLSTGFIHCNSSWSLLCVAITQHPPDCYLRLSWA